MGGRLKAQASAYLRQHADNPVDWWPFGDEAFAEARARDVPVFLSVGYAACHWCHVMAHESFEDDVVAQYLNQRFVSIKVDREERPDVDAVYMGATQAMTGQGGWPMSVFALPDGRAFFAGTYFPPSPIAGRPSFRQVLEAVSEAWDQRREEVQRSAAALAEGLGAAQRQKSALVGALGLDWEPDAVRVSAGSGAPVEDALLEAAVRALAEGEDRVYAGFGGAPKFPPSTALRFLLAHARGTSAMAEEAAGLAGRTLEAMAVSGIYDRLGGGFARYAVDRAWAVPHFEKMLYDNAQLLRLYADSTLTARTDAHRALAADVVRGTAQWLLGEMVVAGGAFASSLDADTLVDGHSVEGGTYVWTRGELEAVLGAEAQAVADLFDTAAGAVEDGAFTLHAGRAFTAAERRLWGRAAPRLRAARAARPQPGRDSKVVAGWNGLAIAALADSGAALGERPLIDAAAAAASYLLEVHWDGAVLRRVSHEGRAIGIEGLLEDYAGCAEGFFALFAATGDTTWYTAAERLLLTAERRFLRGGRLTDSAAPDGPLLAAQGSEEGSEPLDGPTPSGTALFASALLTYSAYSGSARHRALSAEILRYAAHLADRAPSAVGWALAAAQAFAAGPQELAVVGGSPEAAAALADAGRRFGRAGLVLAPAGPDGAADGAVPLLAGRTPGEAGAPRAYLCREMVCQRPVETPAELVELLRAP
ncbi:thioredoxin domain-containing protein [Arthrobacter zhaoguopingii]|uniref:thioredoxin domain-containing protein n=1 Tax=Arthrobacter zhaoguopingii TaxID=2681491 RepID=UPI001357215A|nr:thioredoxin domain-containing protein [Arthrobacter zhaoguopingii]